MTITLSAPGAHTKRRHRFELQQVPPAATLAACASGDHHEGSTSDAGGAATEVDVSASTYDGRNLVQNVFVTAHGDSVCVEVRWPEPLSAQRTASLRTIPYKQIRRKSMHQHKQSATEPPVSRPGGSF